MKNEYNSIPESFRKKHIDKIIKISNKEKRTNKSYLVTSPVKESQLNNIKIIHLKSASKNYSNTTKKINNDSPEIDTNCTKKNLSTYENDLKLPSIKRFSCSPNKPPRKNPDELILLSLAKKLKSRRQKYSQFVIDNYTNPAVLKPVKEKKVKIDQIPKIQLESAIKIYEKACKYDLIQFKKKIPFYASQTQINESKPSIK